MIFISGDTLSEQQHELLHTGNISAQIIIDNLSLVLNMKNQAQNSAKILYIMF